MKEENQEEVIIKRSSLPKRILNIIIEWGVCFIIAFVLYVIINYFFGTISCIRQTSMYPTAIEGERVTVQRATIFKKELNYGDIIIFEAPLNVEPDLSSGDVTAKYEDKSGVESFIYNFIGIGKIEYVKRVIGLPGDHIKITSEGEVYRNSEKIEEEYLVSKYTTYGGSYYDIVVPDGCIYVMGDNRKWSKDSRYFGCIPIDKVTGYVGIRIWPFSRFGKI